ncbi:MAG: alpha/beta hydrolase [Desulfobacterota bacterium]|nr:alpha/beta hydrolase [Thermodesulfobacteriota bacterium]
MTKKRVAMPDYTLLDHPLLLSFIFYPRKEVTPCPANGFDLMVPVGPSVSVACRFYLGRPEWPSILFFHGNGEVASDYDGTAFFYHQKGTNLIVADYRGYGASTGTPTLTDLVSDAPKILEAVREELRKRNAHPGLYVMGRSLGSISAIELAYRHQDSFRGMLIESGFTSVVRIIRHLGIPAPLSPLEEIDRACVGMIEQIRLPTLILHGQNDTLVPFEEAEDLYRHLGSEKKELLMIPGATHNDILIVGLKRYFDAIGRFVKESSALSP